MSIDGDTVYVPGFDIDISKSDRITAYRKRPNGASRELPLKSVLMDLRPPDAVDCHWWRLTAPADPPGEIVTITEDDEFDIRSVVRLRRRRAFLRLGDEWRRLAQDPNVDYLLQNAPDLSWIRVYCAGPMPGWARHDELVKA